MLGLDPTCGFGPDGVGASIKCSMVGMVILGCGSRIQDSGLRLQRKGMVIAGDGSNRGEYL